MGNKGIVSTGNLIWDNTLKKWVPEKESTLWGQLQTSDDLVTIIQYNEPDSRTTVSGVLYSSVSLGTSALETFVSGTNTLTITRTV